MKWNIGRAHNPLHRRRRYMFFMKRIGRGFLTLVFITVVVFVATRLTGDPTQWMLDDSATEAQRAALRTELGLDKNLLTQFGIYIGQIAQGDFGISFFEHRPASEVFFERIPKTIQLMGTSIAVGVILGVATGIIAALKRNSWIDRTFMSLAFFAYAIPNFVLGILLILIFSFQFRLLPSAGSGTIQHLIMPVATIAAHYWALIARITRSSMLDTLQQDYVRTAKAKGVSDTIIVIKHCLRNAFLPVLTLLGIMAGGMVGGSVVVETVFAWPGAGRLIVNAVVTQDFPVLQLAVLLVAVIVIAANLAVDFAYTLLDPRVQYAA